MQYDKYEIEDLDETNPPLYLLSPSTFLDLCIDDKIALDDAAVVVPLLTKMIVMLSLHISDHMEYVDSDGNKCTTRIGDDIPKQHVCTVEMITDKATQDAIELFISSPVRFSETFDYLVSIVRFWLRGMKVLSRLHPLSDPRPAYTLLLLERKELDSQTAIILEAGKISPGNSH